LKPSIINIVKKYEGEYNEEPNEDNIEEKLTVDEMEAKLDEKIPEYNRFDKNHPMKGVFCYSNKLWRFKSEGVDKTNKILNPIITLAKEKLTTENFGEISSTNYFKYRNHFFIYYQKKNEFY